MFISNYRAVEMEHFQMESIKWKDTKIVALYGGSLRGGWYSDDDPEWVSLFKEFCRRKDLNNEKLIRGILTDNLELIKEAVEIGEVRLSDLIMVVTTDPNYSDKSPPLFCPREEAEKRGNQEIIDYIKKMREQQKPPWLKA